MFISENNKKETRWKLFLYLGITVFIVVFAAVYERFSHDVYSFHMWFAWIWVLGFGVVPYLLFFFLPIKKVPGYLTECFYNFGVAMLTIRSIYIGVVDIYGTSREGMITVYTVISIVFLSIGVLLYIIGLLLNKKETVK